MINRIAEEIAYKLKQDLFWVDTCVGIVTPITYKSGDTDKTIPVYFNRKRDLCNGGDYVDLIPDSEKSSIVYMEVLNEPTMMESKRSGVRFSASLNIISWLNYRKINTGIIDTDVLATKTITEIPERLPNDGYVGAFVEVQGATIKDSSVFNKYSYDWGMQYLMYPYDFFFVNVNVEYTIPRGCENIEKNIQECNLKPIILTVGKDKVEIPLGTILQ